MTNLSGLICLTNPEQEKREVSWTLRKYNDNDIPMILELLEICFKDGLVPEKRTKEHWNWEFLDHPEGASDIFVAVDKGTIVGHYGCIPMVLSTPVGEVKARLVVDVMTHPDYQKQGMFTALGRFSMDEIGLLGIPLALGFPTTGRIKQVMPGHAKVGWFPVIEIPVLGRPLNISNVSKVKYRNRILSKIAEWGLAIALRTLWRWKRTYSNNQSVIQQIEFPDARFDDLWNRLHSNYDFIQRRDTRFIKWRFFDSPHREYQIFTIESNGKLSGYAVFRLFKHLDLNGALLIDIIAEEQHERELLIDEVLTFSQKEGADILACMILDSQSVKALKKKGFMKTGEVYTLIIHRSTELIKREDVDNGNRWFITWADFDVL